MESLTRVWTLFCRVSQSQYFTLSVFAVFVLLQQMALRKGQRDTTRSTLRVSFKTYLSAVELFYPFHSEVGCKSSSLLTFSVAFCCTLSVLLKSRRKGSLLNAERIFIVGLALRTWLSKFSLLV